MKESGVAHKDIVDIWGDDGVFVASCGALEDIPLPENAKRRIIRGYRRVSLITYDRARDSVQRILDARPGGPYAITRSRESLVAWLFYWDSKKYQESGRRADRLIGATPILIDRETGQVCPKGLSRPGLDHLAAYAERKGHLQGIWPDSLDARFLTLLSLVRDGNGVYGTWKIEEHIGTLHPQREDVTVLEELIELERRGLVRRREAANGYLWTIARPETPPGP
jgi:hypothetical protein